MQGLPSPADSPSLKPLDSNSIPSSRKRQRSQSMQSDASTSSAKRSLSEGASNDNGIRSPLADELSTETITEIDSYMAEQGEADIPDTIQLPEPTLTPNGSNTPTPPPEKLATIKKLRDQSMKVGDTWYLVARRWYKRWEKACTGEVDKEGGVDESALGPVNNSSLVDKDGNLMPTLLEGIDVEFVPQEAWVLFTTWYGEPAQPLPRNVIPKGITKEPTLELRPPRLKVLLLVKADSSDITGPPHSYITVSVSDTVRTLCSRMAAVVGPQNQGPARIWKVEGRQFDGSKYPSIRLREEGSEILTPSDTTIEDAMIEPDDAFVVELFENGSFIITDPDKLKGNSTPTTTSDVPAPLFSDENDFFKKISNKSTTSTRPESSSTKPNNSPFSFGTSTTRVQHVQDPGILGLGNMGNTCFMNSALQCLAHSKELTDYFISGVYQDELNPDNPLGMHGAIAEAFGSLLHRIWDPRSTSSSYSPRDFKQQLQRFAPQFSGYQQHDSQELLAFLLDGLHEDLNRVLKKPYVEKPDWEGGGDKELVELAQKSWEGYMLRNDSVIVDLFQGQYQSTLICPECNKVSITFDPFMYLTLPLPMQKKWRHEVYYIPWDLEKPHVKVPVEIGRDASMKDLRQLLGRWMNAPPDNLLTMEIFSHKFYKNLGDNLQCGEIQDGDVVVCFELPCHNQQSRAYKKQEDDPFILPVFLTENTPSRFSYKGASLFGYPFIAVIDKKQAASVDAMYDAVVTRLQRWTANARDLYTWEAGAIDPGDNASIRIVSGTPLPLDGPVIEIKENGEVVTAESAPPEEGDIVDEKDMVIHQTEADISMDTSSDGIPTKTGTKKDIFELRLQVNSKDFGCGYQSYGASSPRYEPWDKRQADLTSESVPHPILLKEDDALFCEFDENMKAYYFGEEATKWEHALWETWVQFVHPEFTEAKKANAERKNQGMTLEECMTEFTKEEKLGEDDLWYCPQCKKHQQATKKFDLWKAPDILVVHLKRFSNSRALRDKIDTLVEFPVEGLDIGDLVGERQVAKKLAAAGVDAAELGLKDLDEPLVYDLFAVDEHMGGLGGGHYRAYAENHVTEQWYHFDDSYVTKSRAADSVNANAYLLFYKRRTTRPLGGKSHEKIEEARLKKQTPAPNVDSTPVSNQLPTPPNESSHSSYLNTGHSRLSALAPVPANSASDGWLTPQSNARSSPGSSPPPLEDKGLPSFEDSQFDSLVQTDLDPLHIASRRFDFPEDPSSKASPTSSNEVEPDLEQQSIDTIDIEDGSGWQPPSALFDKLQSLQSDTAEWDDFSDSDSRVMSSSPNSSSSETNPFTDANEQKEERQKIAEKVPDTRSTPLDVDM